VCRKRHNEADGPVRIASLPARCERGEGRDHRQAGGHNLATIKGFSTMHQISLQNAIDAAEGAEAA
jgi:hypothetical protein